MKQVNGDGFKVEEEAKPLPFSAILCEYSYSSPQLLSVAHDQERLLRSSWSGSANY